MRIVVTPDIVSEVLHVPRVAHPDYPGYNRLRTMSKDELLSLFCETSLSWGDSQNTPWSGFAKGLRFLNIVMTFILHPLYHYNSIIEPRARFLSSLLEDISINFPSHFILSLINVYRNTVTHDKLIFPFCYHEAFSQFFYLLSRVSSFHGYECHRRCYRSTERGTAQIKVAPNRNCVKWTPVLVISHDDRLSWVVSLLIPLHLHRCHRMKVMMAPAVMMQMRTKMLARPGC